MNPFDTVNLQRLRCRWDLLHDKLLGPVKVIHKAWHMPCLPKHGWYYAYVGGGDNWDDNLWFQPLQHVSERCAICYEWSGSTEQATHAIFVVCIVFAFLLCHAGIHNFIIKSPCGSLTLAQDFGSPQNPSLRWDHACSCGSTTVNGCRRQ